MTEGYKDTNPYHHSVHAADVMHCGHMFFFHGGLGEVLGLEHYDISAYFIAAMIHD